MIVESNQIFNLMDTNGRRSDVLNALKIYLEILEELKEVYPTESWGTYPDSLSQFLFYEKALESCIPRLILIFTSRYIISLPTNIIVVVKKYCCRLDM